MAIIHKLIAGCFIASDIEEGDVLTIGGSMINSEQFRMKVDFSNLTGLLTKAEHSFAASNMAGLESYAKDLGTNVDPIIMSNLLLLQKILERHVWPKTTKDHIGRQNLYASHEETPLSEIVNQGQMACAELSLISAKILQSRGFAVQTISGAVVDRKVEPQEDGSSDPHSFLALENAGSGHVVIYDPSQPIPSNVGQFPSVFVVSQEEFQHWQEQAQVGIAFLQVTEEVRGKTKYYGAAPPMSCFWPERHIVTSQQATLLGETLPPRKFNL